MKRYFGICAAALAALLAGNAELWAQRTAPDAIYYNAKVVTVDEAFHIAQAFAVKGDRFAAVGGNKEVRALAGKQTRMIDLGGRTVVPGLMDNHHHQYRAASILLRGVETSDVPSLRELLERIRKASANAKPGATVFTASGWRPETFPEKRGPTRKELDEVSGGHPVIVFRGRTEAFVNAAALQALGISRDTESFAGEPVAKDAAGEPTGHLNGSGNGIIDATSGLIPPPTRVERKELIVKMQARQNALGLTGIRELELAPEIMRDYRELEREGKLTLRVSIGQEGRLDDTGQLEEALKSWGVGPGFGSEWLKIDGVAELGIDGVVESAYLRAPMVSPTGANGAIHTTPVKLRETMAMIDRYGWRPSPHIFGDKALDLVLDAYESVDRESPIREKRWTVEHVPLVHSEQMDRMTRMGVLVSAQAQTYISAQRMLQSWGPERTAQAIPMRQLLDHHLSVSSGSDWPAYPSNPFINIYFYVTRGTEGTVPQGVDQRITREEALRVTSINNAYLTFSEKEKGSIEAGKLADFLVLSHDVLTIAEGQLRTVHPEATYVGGRKVFSTASSGL